MTAWERMAKRAHAWMMGRVSGRYEKLVAERKWALLAELRGTVLEIGAGTGPNAVMYGSGVKWIAVEPNPYMHARLAEAARAAGRQVEMVQALAESLPALSGSVDAVVGTLVLCSVEDPRRVMAEVLRVLKPGGRYVYLEHVAAPTGTGRRRWQGLVEPAWRRVADGCRLSRDTEALIRGAGFREIHGEAFRLGLGLVGPHVAGYAVK